ncbi:uncharacterized protein CANTADRAFT_25930 [Suhomyces tanzawaensis NRRL Y-17324]|uniref:SYO1-like TPR repeats domain-containing protein n=1 Tax=Suhomyces tanzawaensis NRRL Y-17324 TaxID=984487 RepID=A0A1E4SLM3_9ASCO|nr:uncharacterized protein CANTADRAFT_25930 [Suhomyces tanzawaensis NRRL Y-17324]ODV80292.1 hypothetical protein CANTADRAFT_25930 [Suhomyces tanzawaensis NRRL Y-17324]
MGKLKRRKNQKARVNPLSRTPGSGPALQDPKKDETTRQTKIIPLLNKLKSSPPNEKSMALGAITVLCEDERMRKMLLKEKLVVTIFESCLTDNNDEIVVESFGLIRNIGIEEGLDVLKHFWRLDLWKHITDGLNKIQTSYKHVITNGPGKDKSKVQLLYDFTENILSLVMVLAGGSNDLYDSIFHQIDPILSLVFDLISNQRNEKSSLRITTKLFNSLLEFIYEFSTESDEFIAKLNQESFELGPIIEHVESHPNQYNELTLTYVEGLKFNYGGSNGYQLGESILNNIYQILSNINLQDLASHIKLANSIPTKDKTMDDITKEGNATLHSKTQLSTLEVSLDLITSILEFLSVNEETALEGEPIQLPPSLVDTLLNKTYPILTELFKFELANQYMLMLTNKILVSLNNLVWLILSTENLPVEWFEKSNEIWTMILQTSFEALDLQKISLNILWGIAKCLGPEVPKNEAMITSLVTKGQELKSAEIKDEAIDVYQSLVGLLGTLAVVVDNTALTAQISQFLFESIDTFKTFANPLATEIVIESFNQIYDIFGDKDFAYDTEIFVQLNYLSKLRQLEPEMKALYKKIDKNKYGQLKLRAEEVWINLGRFIQYKESERL